MVYTSNVVSHIYLIREFNWLACCPYYYYHYYLFRFAEFEVSPVRCQVSEVKSAVCGGEFTVWLTSVEGSSIMYGVVDLIFCAFPEFTVGSLLPLPLSLLLGLLNDDFWLILVYKDCWSSTIWSARAWFKQWGRHSKTDYNLYYFSNLANFYCLFLLSNGFELFSPNNWKACDSSSRN